MFSSSLQTIAPSLNREIIADSVLDAALTLVSDPIPNIRFNVAKALETLAIVLMNTPEGREVAERRIVPALEKLQQDSDADVR
jgi:serine/threonine-protein phosphatase 2A regulatory subunit A